MYLVISLSVLRAGYGICLYQFLIIAYLFTLLRFKASKWEKTIFSETAQLLNAAQKNFSQYVQSCRMQGR